MDNIKSDVKISYRDSFSGQKLGLNAKITLTPKTDLNLLRQFEKTKKELLEVKKIRRK